MPADPMPPYYFQSVDWNQLMLDHPPPPLFGERIGRMSDEEMRAHQDRLFALRVAEAWELPFFQQLWTEHGVKPGDIRSLADLGALPTYDSDDLKGSLKAWPTYGLHHTLGP